MKKLLVPKKRLHQYPLPIIGLTGGIACGKSTVSNFLKDQGHFVLDADQLISEIYQKESSLRFVRGLCPAAIENEVINFKTLRTFAFEDPDLLKKLEDFLYPQMKNIFLAKASTQKHPFIIYDIPLLFEKNLDSLVDFSICVYCPSHTQIMRLIKRDNLSQEEAKNIMSKQMNIEEKKKRSDFIIDNSNDLQDLKQNSLDTLKQLKTLLEA